MNPYITGAECATVQSIVLRSIGGRAYRGRVPAEIRVPIMRDRVAHLEGKAVAGLALGAAAVANYLRDLGDHDAAARWYEMSSDLSSAVLPTDKFVMPADPLAELWSDPETRRNLLSLGRALGGPS